MPCYRFCVCFNRNVDLREYLTEEAQVTEKNTTYDLIANVVHDGKPNEGAYRIHVLHHVICILFLILLLELTMQMNDFTLFGFVKCSLS